MTAIFSSPFNNRMQSIWQPVNAQNIVSQQQHLAEPTGHRIDHGDRPLQLPIVVNLQGGTQKKVVRAHARQVQGQHRQEEIRALHAT